MRSPLSLLPRPVRAASAALAVLLYHRHFQPRPDECQHPPVAHAPRDTLHRRVENWRADSRSRFQLPPRQTQHAVFPHCAFLLSSSHGLWGLLTGERFPRQIADPVLREQSEPLIKPPPTPPRPAKSPASALVHQVSPYLLLDPIPDVTEASARHPYAKVVHPSTQDRVDQAHDPLDRLRTITPEYFLESAQEFGTCLHRRHISDPPLAPPRLHSAELKPQKGEALALGKVNTTRLVTIEFSPDPAMPGWIYTS